MQFEKIICYSKKIFQLGPFESFRILKSRIKRKASYSRLKIAAENKRARHNWQTIVLENNLDMTFPCYFEKLKNNLETFFPEKIIENIDHDELNQNADLFAKNIFNILGSGHIKFKKVQWHIDFRLRNQNPEADFKFSKDLFYQDIKISYGKTLDNVKDIKVPWELSRCYHFAVLGCDFKKTGDNSRATVFVKHASDWIAENDFMLGVNWVCPMEVAIRAINWVVGLYYFKDEPSISDQFWELFVCSLYDHFVYLENNWEKYGAKTSNHYLSDLLGYFFLCFFFKDLPEVKRKKEWCLNEILHEYKKQVFAEGADYEGSTSYHCLVTEIFYLFFQLCKKNKLELPENFEKKLSCMFDFIDWCTPNGCSMIKIGDDDSGKILYSGLSKKLICEFSKKKEKDVKHFYSFGISIIKEKKWHVTLRHHSYNKNQPSGHFHNDFASINLTIDENPIFIDSGSFVYTPSLESRNQFRSVNAHNSFGVLNHEPVEFDDNMFELNIPEKKMDIQNDNFILNIEHDLYKRFGLRASRTVELKRDKNILTISDLWISKRITSGLIGCWNFLISPGIDLIHEKGIWFFQKDDKTILCMSSSDLQFENIDSWVSFEYGKKFATRCLRAVAPIVSLTRRITIFYPESGK